MRLVNMRKQRSERGDTIIEVMISLAVLGLAFAISYATASHALTVSQTNQEHSSALELLNSQVELARSEAVNTDLYNTSGKWFCMQYDSAGEAVKIKRYDANSVSAAPDACKAPVNNSVDYVMYGVYKKNTDKYNIDQNDFKFTIKWPGLGDQGLQQEQINYKIHADIGALTGRGDGAPASCPPGYTDTWPDCRLLTSITVVAKKIAADSGSGNRTPSCSKPAKQNKSGTKISLSLNGSFVGSQTTSGDSTTTFDNLLDGNTYKASISGAPSGYQACPPTSGSAMAKQGGGGPSQIDLKIRPVCFIDHYTNHWEILGRDASLDGWWREGNTTPDELDSQVLTYPNGKELTKSDPYYWYFIGHSDYYDSPDGFTYRDYTVYDAIKHSNAVWKCP